MALPGSSTGTLSAKQIAELARGAGWRDDQSSQDPTKASELAVAVAIALCESGGRTEAVDPRSGATGLWQIYPGDPKLTDAQLNATVAYGKYQANGSRFGRGSASTCLWSCYCSRAYLVHLPVAEIAVRGTHRDRPAFTGGGTGLIHNVIDFTGNIGHDLAAFFGWITSGETWIRLGEAIGGAILILLALWLVLSHTQAGRDVKAGITKGATL